MTEKTNGDSVRFTRSTVSLLVAVFNFAALVGAIGYQAREQEARDADKELRLRRVEEAVIRMQSNTFAIGEQNEQLKDLRQEVRELTRQLDRIR